MADATKPIDVHYWPTPNGRKITIALEEMGLPYRIVPVNIGKGEQFTPEFLAISPNNRMPAIVDPEGPDGQPISIFESGAILQYLARKTGHVRRLDRPRAGRSRSLAGLAGRQSRPGDGPPQPFPELRTQRSSQTRKS